MNYSIKFNYVVCQSPESTLYLNITQAIQQEKGKLFPNPHAFPKEAISILDTPRTPNNNKFK